MDSCCWSWGSLVVTNELVTLNDNNVPTTTSIQVAEYFDKEHRSVLASIRTLIDGGVQGFMQTHGNVIRKIESLECSIEFARLNFELCSRTVNGREFPMYELTRDGFSFLVNKMSGPEASEFTENFIGAFNAMELEILEAKFGKQETFQIPKTLSEALKFKQDFVDAKQNHTRA
jgi:Rha family phage regulatory protein